MKCKGMLLVLLLMFMAGCGQEAGLRVTALTEQVTANHKDAMTARLGYYMGNEKGGLEPFVGCTWFTEDSSPQVISLGAKQYTADLLDPNSNIPLIPDLLLKVITDEAVMRPYFGGAFTVNFFDRDAGFFEALAGLDIMLEPGASSSIEFETVYGSMFGDLSDRDDYELIYRLGFVIPFPQNERR